MTLFDLLDANMDAVRAVGGQALAQARCSGVPACYMDPELGAGLVREMPDGTRERFHRVDGEVIVIARYGPRI